MQNRNIFHRYSPRKIYSISTLLFILLCLLFLFACDSSDTRSITKSSTSSETELQVRITSPSDGATVAFTVKVGKEDEGPTAEVIFNASNPLGGTKPYSVTFLSKGPTTSNSATAVEVITKQEPPPAESEDDPEPPPLLQFVAELTFLETGIHKIDAVARDARGLTVSDSITITVVAGAN